MNTKNNKRRRESVEKIEKAFTELLQFQELKDITVTDICKMTGLNRSTFYANFLDIYDLADKFREKLESEFGELFIDYNQPEQNADTPKGHSGAVKMFKHIKDNQLFYKTYFKLAYDEQNAITIYDKNRAEKDFDNKNIKYHIEFFKNGLNAIIKMWLRDGCKESPEEMAEVLRGEYRGRY